MSREPSTAKSVEMVTEYMNEIRDFWKQHRDGEASLQTIIGESRVAQQKARGNLGVADLADVYLDEKRHEQWIESHQKHLEAELSLQLENTRFSEAFLDKLNEKERAIRETHDATTAVPQDTAGIESVLSQVRQVLSLYPEVRAKLFQASPDLAAPQDDFDLGMRDTMEALRQHLQNEAVNDLKAQFLSSLDWKYLVQSMDMQAAPKFAFARMQENDSLRSELAASNEETEQLKRTINDLRGQIQRETYRREQAVGELDHFKSTARSQMDEIREGASHASQEAGRKQTELESTLVRLRGDLLAASQSAASERQKFEQGLHAQKAQFTSDLQESRQELAEARAKLDSVTEGSTQADLEISQIDAPGKDAEDQQQAVVGFARYCLGVSSAVIPPSIEQMQTLQSQCYESTLSEGISGLPAIVITSSQMPAAWSYLSAASAGVSMNSRFNQKVISPAICSELPWINDTLARVIDATRNETITADLRRILIVVLQGIAYVHLAGLLWMKKSLKPEPSALLASLIHVERGDGSVLGMVHQQVYDLVHHATRITSWVRDGFTGGLLNTTNSALPQGVALVHRDTPGTAFLRCSAGLFIIDETELNFDVGYMSAKLRMPSGVPDDLRQMDLATEEHIEALKWALGIYRP